MELRLTLGGNVGDAPFPLKHNLSNPALRTTEEEGNSGLDCGSSCGLGEVMMCGEGVAYFPSAPGLSTFLIVRQQVHHSEDERDKA